MDGHDPRSYAVAIGRVLGDPELAATLAAGAVDHSARFSWEATVSRLLELYEGISAAARQ